MRIGFHSAVLQGRRTGVNNYAYQVLLALSQCEPDIELMGASVGGVRRFTTSDFLGSNQSVPEFSVSPWRQRALQLAKASPAARKFRRIVTSASVSLSYRLKPVDLFHAFNYVPPARLFVPILPVVYDLSFVRHPEMHPVERVKALASLPKVVRDAPFVHTISHFSKAEIVDLLGYPAERIVVVYPAASEVFGPKSIDDARLRIARFSVEPFKYFLAVGTIEPRKNLKTLVAAYSQLPAQQRAKYPLLIIGGEGWGNVGFPTETNRLVQAGSLRFLGYVSDENLAALYSATRLMLFPSTYEGFGMPVVEAMACGAPVAHSAESAMDEISNGLAERVPALDIARWRQVLATSIEDDASLNQQSRSARATQAGQFDWSVGAKTIASLYRSVLGS